jgi:hypothetical protein
MCPKCGEVYEHTQCLACAEFSPHRDWYHSDTAVGRDLEKEKQSDAPQEVDA